MKNYVRFLILTAFITWGAPQLAADEVVKNKANWVKLSAAEQEGYVKGIWDANSILIDSVEQMVTKTAVKHCAEDRKFTARIVADAVTDTYQTNPKRADNPAAIIVIGLLYHACLDYINEAREKAGLDQLAMWDDW